MNVTSRQVNGGRPFETQRNLGALGRNQGIDHPINITAGQKMGFQLVYIEVQTGFGRLNKRCHNPSRRDPAKTHTDQIKNADLDILAAAADIQRPTEQS